MAQVTLLKEVLMSKTAVTLQTNRLVVGWGSRSGKCVSSESPGLDGAARGRSLAGALQG